MYASRIYASVRRRSLCQTQGLRTINYFNIPSPRIIFQERVTLSLLLPFDRSPSFFSVLRSMDATLELFHYNSTYQVWICKKCQSAVTPNRLVSHLARKHTHHPSARTSAQRAAIYDEVMKVHPWNPDEEPFQIPPPDARPIHGLPVYTGYRCPEETCTYVARQTGSVRTHRHITHGPSGRRRGRQRETDPVNPTLQPVKCQRFFTSCAHSGYFEVLPAADERRTQQALDMKESDFIQAQVDLALLRSDGFAEAEDEVAPTNPDVTEASPWLELTRWPEYVRGYSFNKVASLAFPPDPATEPLLIAVERSVRRLIQLAFDSISSHRINEFDQVRINSFVQKPGVWERPIQIKLRPSTYSRYRQVWVRLLSFVYRTSRPNQRIELRHQFSTRQLTAIDEIERWAKRLLLVENRGTTPEAEITSPIDPQLGSATLSPAIRATKQLDRACLDLSIALLDQELRGDIFESPLVAFMAALGLDARNHTYYDPANYTTHLSALVKISQMLVAQRAVELAEDGHVEHPSDALDEMRERFLVYGVRAPFGWITRLRTYGKKIQNTSTSLGYLTWSDDHQSLHYRDLQLTMDALTGFIRAQVELAQYELERLFLLEEEEIRADIVPELPLQQLTDDPVNNQRGWNFLKHQKNRRLLPTTGERWMLDRILTNESLRKDFIDFRASDATISWKTPLVAAYLDWVDQFLERLLILIHMTAGQPARATELISIRHRNTPEGRHRNIFIEHGLVSIVTSYHKSQSTSNSIKIIHRYLPREVSELVVYYLWLIHPFTEQAGMFARGGDSRVRSPFFWPKEKSHWDAARLGVIMKKEAEIRLHTKLNVLTWRHAAIGIYPMGVFNT